MIKSLARAIAGKLGYEIIRKGTRGSRFDIYNGEHLARLCRPGTVIDIGVGRGTQPLYDAYPEAYFILVEPLREHEEDIRGILSRLAGEVHFKAASDADGPIEFLKDKANTHLSSMHRRIDPDYLGRDMELRTIEAARMDSIIGPERVLKAPVLMKIDTEGNELRVLKGAERLLEAVDVVIAEASIVALYEEGYRFEELMSHMVEKGFYLHSFLHIHYKAGVVRPKYADVVFFRDPGRARGIAT